MKQESLEMFLKCCLASTITNVNWQWIPSRWRWEGESLSVNLRRVRGVLKSPLDLERSRLSVHGLQSSHKYNGAVPWETRYIKTHSLNLMRLSIGSQCSSLKSGWLRLHPILACDGQTDRQTDIFRRQSPR